VNAARGIVGEAPDLRALLLAPSSWSGVCWTSTRMQATQLVSTF
jgi:hypothetical protein